MKQEVEEVEVEDEVGFGVTSPIKVRPFGGQVGGVGGGWVEGVDGGRVGGFGEGWDGGVWSWSLTRRWSSWWRCWSWKWSWSWRSW